MVDMVNRLLADTAAAQSASARTEMDLRMDYSVMRDECRAATAAVVRTPASSQSLADACGTADAAAVAVLKLASVIEALVEEVEALRERLDQPTSPTTRLLVHRLNRGLPL